MAAENVATNIQGSPMFPQNSAVIKLVTSPELPYGSHLDLPEEAENGKRYVDQISLMG